MFSRPMSCSDVAAILASPSTKARASLIQSSATNEEIDSTLSDLARSQEANRRLSKSGSGHIVEGEGIDEAARHG